MEIHCYNETNPERPGGLMAAPASEFRPPLTGADNVPSAGSGDTGRHSLCCTSGRHGKAAKTPGVPTSATGRCKMKMQQGFMGLGAQPMGLCCLN